MNAEDLNRWGVPKGDATRTAFKTIKRLINEAVSPEAVRSQLLKVIHEPAAFTDHAHWGPLAEELLATPKFTPRESPAPWRQWGDNLDDNAIEQMRNACQLPVAVAGALMPDAHLGYGLPIGGVLATENAIVPYAVGVDIACRMKMTVLDIPLRELDDDRGRQRLTTAIEKETRFGTGAAFTKNQKRKHAVLDQDWSITEVTKKLKEKAWGQLGTSGSGN